MTLEQFIRTNKRFLECGHSLQPLLRSYKYQLPLTRKLDGLGRTEFSPATINEIVLWKLNRFVDLSNSLIAAINKVKRISFDQLEDARPVLERLLRTSGIQLAMASTILRFRNPWVFQIIDERAYRVAFGKRASYPKKIGEGSDRYVDRSVKIYFDYLHRLRAIADQCGFEYTKLDRALYLVDKKRKNPLRRGKRA